MRRIAGWIIVAALALGVPCVASAADVDNPACAAALDLILSFARHGKRVTPLVVADAADSAEAKDYTPDTLLTAGWTQAPPSADLAQAFLSLPAVSAVSSCPSLPAALSKENIGYGDDAVARVTTVDPSIVSLPTYVAEVLTLSLPVVSGDGKDALVQDSLCQGENLCVGSIWHLQRDKSGKWKPISGLSAPTS
jgi:hypothetical protein